MRVHLVSFSVSLCLRLFLLWMQKLVTRTHSHLEDKGLTSVKMTLKRSVQKALVSCDHTKSWSLWPPHLQQWWDVGSRWGSRCVWCTHAWTVCSRRRAAAGKDIGRTAPTAGPHSGASGPEGDTTRPPGPRKTYKGERWMWRKIPYTRFNFESVFKMRAKCVFFLPQRQCRWK